MKNGSSSRPRSRRRAVMKALASARPASLDPGRAGQVGWPDASYFTGSARPAEDPDAATQASLRPSSRRAATTTRAGLRSGPGGRKLLAAACSAIATAALTATVLAIVPGTLPGGGTKHHSPPGAAAGEVTTIRLNELRLLGHWRGQLRYGSAEGIVYLAGTAGESSGNGILTTLPPGARPDRRLDLLVSLAGHTTGTIVVTPDGQIEVSGPRKDLTFVSLDGLEFPLGS